MLKAKQASDGKKGEYIGDAQLLSTVLHRLSIQFFVYVANPVRHTAAVNDPTNTKSATSEEIEKSPTKSLQVELMESCNSLESTLQKESIRVS